MTELLTLQYGTTQIQYELVFVERKQLAIHVYPDLRVVVEVPLDTPMSQIEAKLHKRAAWILRQQRELRRYAFEQPPRFYVSGESHRYLGRQFRLKVIPLASGPESVKLSQGFFFLSTRSADNREHKQSLLEDWYRSHARVVFEERLLLWLPRFERYDLQQPEIVIRKMKSRWGSCTAAGVITLNLKLIQHPKRLIDYIIVHELVHLVEHNHGPAFYQLLTKVMPDWENRRTALNEEESG
jgi:predicted metal-dependent hydrolase